MSVLAALVLTLFALFRGVSGLIPIAAVRDSAILKTFDTFLTGWFGDVRILLYDPAQSANIRGGLARAVRALRAQGCGRMVIVAHSGGVMVSYLTLTDPALDDVQVDKLITFGEGWNLALRLSPKRRQTVRDGGSAADGHHPHPEEPSLARLLGNERPGPGRAAAARRDRPSWRAGRRSDAARSGIAGASSTITARTGPTTRSSSSRVLREIDVPDGWGEARSSIPPDVACRCTIGGRGPGGLRTTAGAWPLPAGVEPGPRAVRHRQRVATLAMWRQTAIAVPIAVIAIALAVYPGRLDRDRAGGGTPDRDDPRRVPSQWR